ncbi:phage shock protein C (PspC) family protein [Tessaracoccus bendigoensis DSM 12906]|uniref:Phage shock protein C (PspC) family protein n=1 Tax=Tessaracoccus bendigoensis DSM 12906 TaxID=1123357 RepID=A0A1M6FCZ1_9ACTN|nr:PspC domain-containing protein [Tessaracoccus bendigoensis]SHI95489.1 phage shock protein C (PspC) family protein [Tessaracoccus bendigoensis DSM 12906]
MARDLDRNWLTESLAPVRRRNASGLGSGLSRAIAAQLGVDVVIVRVAFVVLTFCAGLGVALYCWGTLLTIGPRGTRPIDSLIDSFRSWSTGGQLALIIATSIAVVATVGSVTSLPWGMALLAVGLLALLLRRNRGHSGADVSTLPESADQDELIDDWRRRMSFAAGTNDAAPFLPTDLPLLPQTRPPAVAAPRPRSAWLMGTLFLGGASAVSVLCALVLGLTTPVSVAIACIVLGVALTIFAAVSRTRRVPRPFLAVCVVALVASGWLSSSAPLAEEPTDGAHVVRAVATDTKIDLTGLADVDHIEVIAVAASVEIIVPGTPEGGITTTQRFSHVESGLTGDRIWPGVRLTIDATASDVTIEEAAS